MANWRDGDHHNNDNSDDVNNSVLTRAEFLNFRDENQQFCEKSQKIIGEIQQKIATLLARKSSCNNNVRYIQRRTPSYKKIPFFDGDMCKMDFIDWLLDLEGYFNFWKICDKEKVRLASNKLDNEVEERWEDIQIDRKRQDYTSIDYKSVYSYEKQYIRNQNYESQVHVSSKGKGLRVEKKHPISKENFEVVKKDQDLLQVIELKIENTTCQKFEEEVKETKVELIVNNDKNEEMLCFIFIFLIFTPIFCQQASSLYFTNLVVTLFGWNRPICRTVADAVYVLDAIVGIDHYDNATIETSQYIPKGGYAQFLKTNGLRAKRVGIVRDFYIGNDTIAAQIVEQHLKTLRKQGTILVDNLKITNIGEIYTSSNEDIALAAEFKRYINAYLKELVVSPVRSLSDLIAFNKKNSKLERLDYGQDLFIKAEATNGIGNAEKAALLNLAKLTREGFVKLITKNKLDAIVTPGDIVSRVLAIGGFPGVIVPAGYGSDRKPFGLCFGGLKGSEPKLIEIAYGFEQATKIRKPPKLTT
ncbi:uncharacterized protein LOC112002211 [Quercus suber]|uniref:uncharacterized protein LOC112002211 n=1 Tax=Quercus suber TaxID=58331 RepID=UPI0032DE74EF